MAKKKPTATPSDPTTPEILESFDFREFGAGKADYNWDTWLDGQIRKLLAGTHFHCKPETFLTLARNAARKAGMVVKTGKVEGGVVIQAVEASADQLQRWAEQDAIKKAKEAEEAEEQDEE